MVHGLIITDNVYNDSESWVGRGSGAHRIASFLRKNGYNIEVVDYCSRWNENEFADLCKKLIGPETLFLGVGSNLFYEPGNCNSLINVFKDLYADIPVILGGNNLLGRGFENIDYMIEGFAESAILPLLSFLQGHISKKDIKFSNKAPNLLDALHDYPHVDTNDLSISYQPSDFIKSNEFLGIETARGCIFKCKYCTMPLIGKKKLDYLRDTKNIVDEMMENYQRWGATYYIINEDTFNDSLEKVEALAKAVKTLPFTPQILCYLRLDLVVARPEIIDHLRILGVRGVHFGIETFGQSAGKIIGKGMSAEKIKQGLLWFKQQMPQTSIHCTMIVGLPGDTFEEAAAAQKWYTDNEIGCWNFWPLWLMSEQALYTSEFGKTYLDYGIVPMEPEEIEQGLAKERDDPMIIRAAHYMTALQSAWRKKIMYWKYKNSDINFFSACKEAVRLNSMSRNRKVSSWAIATYAPLGYSIDDIQTWGYDDHEPGVPQEEIKKRALDFISKYKKDKLAFDYQAFYKNKTQDVVNRRIFVIRPADPMPAVTQAPELLT